MVTTRTHIVAPLLLAFLLSLGGCKDEVKEAWQMGYQANYKSGHQAGLEAGHARGKAEGEKKGTVEARQAAETGCAWQLYFALACGGLVVGIVAGLLVQYTILLGCRLTERLPPLSMFAFIPAMKTTISYSIFERRCRLMLQLDEELEKVRATRNLRAAQIQAVHDAVKRRIMAAGSIAELTQARLIELANEEFSKIIAAAEKANEVRKRQHPVTTHSRIVCTCPHCRKKVQFPIEAANTIVSCPYEGCGGLIALPSISR